MSIMVFSRVGWKCTWVRDSALDEDEERIFPLILWFTRLLDLLLQHVLYHTEFVIFLTEEPKLTSSLPRVLKGRQCWLWCLLYNDDNFAWITCHLLFGLFYPLLKGVSLLEGCLRLLHYYIFWKYLPILSSTSQHKHHSATILFPYPSNFFRCSFISSSFKSLKAEFLPTTPISTLFGLIYPSSEADFLRALKLCSIN